MSKNPCQFGASIWIALGLRARYAPYYVLATLLFT